MMAPLTWIVQLFFAPHDRVPDASGHFGRRRGRRRRTFDAHRVGFFLNYLKQKKNSQNSNRTARTAHRQRLTSLTTQIRQKKRTKTKKNKKRPTQRKEETHEKKGKKEKKRTKGTTARRPWRCLAEHERHAHRPTPIRHRIEADTKKKLNNNSLRSGTRPKLGQGNVMELIPDWCEQKKRRKRKKERKKESKKGQTQSLADGAVGGQRELVCFVSFVCFCLFLISDAIDDGNQFRALRRP